MTSFVQYKTASCQAVRGLGFVCACAAAGPAEFDSTGGLPCSWGAAYCLTGMYLTCHTRSHGHSGCAREPSASARGLDEGSSSEQECGLGPVLQAGQGHSTQPEPSCKRISGRDKVVRCEEANPPEIITGSTCAGQHSTTLHSTACKTEKRTWVVALLDSAQLGLDFLADKTQNNSKCKQPT